ncbi:uncharacterized protein Hap1MRO34_002390 [Clarias gariepinus]|uniref:G8 domain-containing protein DDB_G0286311-like n=1 Tax=Clarias gariepinus TaxID=13013 RepID=UPI00234D774F|nr:G8 domain-containing protein DDB_G0286311-like [Clarias gariepinus]
MEVSMLRYTWAALCITVSVMSGMSLGKPVENNESPEPLVTYDLTMDITNQIFNDSLLKSESSDYEILFTKVTGALFSIYGCSTCNTQTFYQGVSAMTFSNKTGTVLVKATLKFHTNQINSDVIIHLFKKAIAANDEINSLKINSKFTQATSEPTTSPPNTTKTTTTHRPSASTNTHRPSASTSTHRPTASSTKTTPHPTTTTTTTTTTPRPTTTTTTPLPTTTTTTTTTTRPTTTTTTTTRPTTTTTTTTRPTTTTTTRRIPHPPAKPPDSIKYTLHISHSDS